MSSREARLALGHREQSGGAHERHREVLHRKQPGQERSSFSGLYPTPVVHRPSATALGLHHTAGARGRSHCARAARHCLAKFPGVFTAQRSVLDMCTENENRTEVS